MALKSKLLDRKVVEPAKETLKEVRSNAYVAKKTKCCNCSKKYSITAVVKIYCISRRCTNYIDKAPKIWRKEELSTSLQHHRKTKLDQS
ncbi:hypothetical protein GO684_00290 [Wolbachia endosymbiont of Litomosoides brasiliensis]|uniref:hypothetical protein n=1 Tax=Wolbachia endosymbiont of Litomosoides brasiliensis TaxID=1812117 RepID=UPI00158ED202|nr:hypothetical protein [Wolbachia endosymbiont of Litomosoides brasiliensis]NUY39193.1 hypothetical protein [Wolbachia endosymbiont of Litomosoides brasiliensis]